MCSEVPQHPGHHEGHGSVLVQLGNGHWPGTAPHSFNFPWASILAISAEAEVYLQPLLFFSVVLVYQCCLSLF